MNKKDAITRALYAVSTLPLSEIQKEVNDPQNETMFPTNTLVNRDVLSKIASDPSDSLLQAAAASILESSYMYRIYERYGEYEQDGETYYDGETTDEVGFVVNLQNAINNFEQIQERVESGEFISHTMDVVAHDNVRDTFQGEIVKEFDYNENPVRYGINSAMYSSEFRKLAEEYDRDLTDEERIRNELSLETYLEKRAFFPQQSSVDDLMAFVSHDKRLSQIQTQVEARDAVCRAAGQSGIVVLDAADISYEDSFRNNQYFETDPVYKPDIMTISTRENRNNLISAMLSIKPEDKPLMDAIMEIANEKCIVSYVEPGGENVNQVWVRPMDLQETGNFRIEINDMNQDELNYMYAEIVKIANEYQQSEWTAFAENHAPQPEEQQADVETPDITADEEEFEAP